MLKLLAKLLKALNSDASPSQIAFGFIAGLVVGLTPLWSLHNLAVVFLVLVLRVNVSAFLLSWIIFSAIAYLVDPLTESIGATLLAQSALQEFWTSLYNVDFWRLTHFNNTLTLGSFVTSVVLALPLFFVSRVLVVKYRVHVLAWVQKLKLVQIIKASKFWRIYATFSGGGSLS